MNRPPQDITPAGFFAEWLPAQLGARKAGSPMTIRVLLEGDGGGAWDLRLGPEGLTVGPPGADEPEVTVSQTVADWKAFTLGEKGAVSLAPPQASPTDILFLDAAAQSIVKNVQGIVRFEVTGYNDRTWSLTVKFGPRPMGAAEATISVDAETYAAMLARQMPPPQAYFQGKIRITGDANLAMQLGMAMLPRFG